MTTTRRSSALSRTSPDEGLKSAHRRMWALGDYPSVAEVIGALGPVVVEAVGLGPGDRVLDVAAGSGNASIPAAKRGADVVASDLTPVLLDSGRAAGAGVPMSGSISWEEADAEALPYADAAFDAVISVVGVMFAPHHQQAADELLRVCRSGGRIGLVSWTPEGFIGQMFATMRPYAPAPPPGAQPPPRWGDEEHVRELLGDEVVELELSRRELPVDRFATPSDFREFFKARYGPTIAVYDANAGDPARCEALDRDLDALVDRFADSGGSMTWEYLLVTARRRQRLPKS